MKNYLKAILVGSLLFCLFIIFKQNETNNYNFDLINYKQRQLDIKDSLLSINKESLILKNQKIDSLILLSFKKEKKYITKHKNVNEKIENFTDSTRNKYLDSLFRTNGIRK